MSRKTHPIDLPGARVMMLWPYWVLALLTPLVHIVGAALLPSAASPGSSTSARPMSTITSLGILTTISPTLLVFTVVVAITLWYSLEHRDVDRSVLAGDGWEYRRRTAPTHPGRFLAFPFPLAGSAQLTSHAWGPLGNDLCASYTMWSTPTHRYAVEMVDLPAVLPPVVIVPARWRNRAAQGRPLVPVTVKHTAFTQRWTVLAADPRAAQAVLQARMVEAILSADLPADAGVTIDGAALMIWSPGVPKPQHLRHRLEVARELATAVPVATYRQFGSARPAWWGPASMSEWVSSPDAHAIPSYRTLTLDEEVLAFAQRSALTPVTGAFLFRREANERFFEKAARNRVLLHKSHVGFARVVYGGITAMVCAVGVPIALKGGLGALAAVPLIGVLLGGLVISSGVRRIADASGRPQSDVWKATVHLLP